jgi:hypothetical protein
VVILSNTHFSHYKILHTEKCLNHTEENKVKRIYQRQKLEAEQAEAWQVLGDRLTLLINMDDSNVVLLHKRI